MTETEINALALIAANVTPLGLLSSMEARTILAWLNARGNLVTPPQCTCINHQPSTEPKETDV